MVEDRGLGGSEWIRVLSSFGLTRKGFVVFFIFCIPKTTNRVKSRDKLSLSSYKAGVKSQR